MIVYNPIEKISFATDLYFGGKRWDDKRLPRWCTGRRGFDAGNLTLRNGEAVIADVVLNTSGILFHFIGIDAVAVLQVNNFRRGRQASRRRHNQACRDDKYTHSGAF